MNRATLYGRLAHTPELKALPNGTKVASMSLATNYTYKDPNGQKVEQTDWHNLKAFGKLAEVLAQYCEGGQQMLFEGRLVTQSWEDKDTQKKMYRTEIIISDFEFGAKSLSRQEKQGQGEAKPARTREVKTGGYEGDVATIDYGSPDINLDDIPF